MLFIGIYIKKNFFKENLSHKRVTD